LKKHTIPDNNFIQKRLAELFDGKEWISHRHYFRKIRDHQVFVSSNILAILAKCKITNPTLIQQIEICKQHLKTYQKDHLTYFWPLKNGRSVMPNSRILSKIRAIDLSPDADVTSLYQVVLRESENIDKIIDELTFYRVDNKNFRLPKCQAHLPKTDHTFLTWFPDKKESKNQKIETVDIVVDANILWFLAEFERLDISGCNETMKFIENILTSKFLLKNPFVASHYYPFVPVILYFIARAIVWGKIKQMYHLKDIILELAATVAPKNDFEKLCLCSVYLFFGQESKTRNLLQEINFGSFKQPGTFYIAPFLAPVMLRFPLFETFAKRSIFHVKFKSEALQWAMLLWITQKLN